MCMCSRQQVLWANSLLYPEMRPREEAGEGEADGEEKCQAHSEKPESKAAACCAAHTDPPTQPLVSHIICLATDCPVPLAIH